MEGGWGLLSIFFRYIEPIVCILSKFFDKVIHVYIPYECDATLTRII